MDLNFTVSLTDIGFGLDVSGNSESERQEILDFLVSVDESMADAEFTRNLVYRLVEDYSHDVEVRGDELMTVPGIQESRQVTFAQLYRGLSYMDEDKLIALMANAMIVRRERDAVASLSLDTACLCGHTLNYHDSLKQGACDVVYVDTNAVCGCMGFYPEENKGAHE